MTAISSSTQIAFDQDPEALSNRYRRELTGYCYRMLGAASEAEDAAQETLVRAWRNLDGFEGRSSIRSWLYRIATNVCLDMLKSSQRRARPMDLSAPRHADSALGGTLPEAAWITPVPDGRVLDPSADPAVIAESRESLRLAFIAALQLLPPRQRAVLLLRDVLSWSAADVASLLDMSVGAVTSALQRARGTIAATAPQRDGRAAELDAGRERLAERYIEAFERYDMTALAMLLREDVIQSMPPYELWLRGRQDVLAWWSGPGAECRGSRLVRVNANGCIAFGQYRPSGVGGRHEPWALQVLELAEGQIAGFTAFLDTAALFPLFGLPEVPDCCADR